ncbi:hypothetical protein FKM82_023139 [Ascaphus truei]
MPAHICSPCLPYIRIFWKLLCLFSWRLVSFSMSIMVFILFWTILMSGSFSCFQWLAITVLAAESMCLSSEPLFVATVFSSWIC